jgi:hypothetical protein
VCEIGADGADDRNSIAGGGYGGGIIVEGVDLECQRSSEFLEVPTTTESTVSPKLTETESEPPRSMVRFHQIAAYHLR